MLVLFKTETETRGRVYSINSAPESLPLEVRAKGIEIESVPEALPQFGKSPIQYINPQTKEIWTEYVDRDLTETEEIMLLKESTKTADQKYKELDKTAASLEDVRNLKIEQLKEACTLAIYEGFASATTGYSFGFNLHDQQNMDQQYLWVVSGENALADIKWKSKDAGIVTLTEEQFIGVTREAKDHKIAQQAKYWTLEAQVLAATTKEAIDLINW